MTTQNPTPPFSPEELLQYRPWVCGLARALVRDECGAEDLAQDTWAAALRNPPERTGSITHWLATVMRNRLRDTRRADSRRAARELGSLRRRLVEGPDELAHRAELHRRLITEVLALPDAYRDVILLRYFEGREPAEIAELRGVPASTVRTRLSRALARLREVLDERAGGDGSAWALALAPLSAPVEPPRAPVAAVALKGLLAAAVAAVVVAVFLLQVHGPARPGAGQTSADAARSAPESPRPPPTRGRRPAPTADRAEAPRPVPEDEAGEQAPASPEPSGSREIQVRVRDAAGRPVAGAEVTFLEAGRGAKSGVPLEARVPSGAAGTATIRLEKGGIGRVLVRSAGRAGLSGPVDAKGEGPFEVTVGLAPGTRLEGRVRGPAGAAMEGARVTVEANLGLGYRGVLETRSAAGGHFLIQGVPRALLRLEGHVVAAASGYGAVYVDFGPDRELPSPLELVLSRSVELTARFVDGDGQPIRGVWVDCADVQGSKVSGADGRVRFRTTVAGEKSFTTDHDAYAATRVPLPFDDGDALDLGDVVLRPGKPIEGVALRPDGRAAAGAFVYVLDRQVDQIVRQGSADEQGRFRFEHLGPGPHVVEVAWKDEGSGERLTWHAKALAPGGDPIEARLSPALMLRLRFVTGPNDAPATVHGVHVTAEPPGDEDPIRINVYSESGKQTESIRLRVPGRHAVTVRVDGFEPVAARDVVVEEHGATELLVRLVPVR